MLLYSKVCLYSLLLPCLCLFLLSCEPDKIIIVPEDGYNWPDEERAYWPTEGWKSSSMEEHNIDPLKMDLANQFAENDPLSRALLVVEDGYIVFENYYGTVIGCR